MQVTLPTLIRKAMSAHSCLGVQLSISEQSNKEIHVRTYVFVKRNGNVPKEASTAVVGVMVCNNFMSLTSVQIDKLNSHHIEVIQRRPEVAEHEGHLNRVVDLLCENGKLEGF